MPISSQDLEVFEKHKEASGHAYSSGEVVPEDREKYWKIFQELTKLTVEAQKAAGLLGNFEFFSCRLSKDGGIQGQRPKDIWTALYPKDSSDFAKHPEIYIIASHNGIEIGLAVSVNERNYYNADIKRRNRKLIPAINNKLPLPGSPEIIKLEDKLSRSEDWNYYNHKEREWPHEKDYKTFSTASGLFSFLKADPTSSQGGGAICRYILKEVVDDSENDLRRLFTEAVTTFAPICLQCTPTSQDKLQIEHFDLMEEAIGNVPDFEPSGDEDGRKMILAQVAVRQGQRKFREELIGAYEGRCAITGMNVLEVLQAAHITPYNGKQTNHIQNGLLLRADIHTLFDLKLLTIDPETMKVVVSEELMKTPYKRLQGRKIRLPENKNKWPSKKVLKKHSEEPSK